MTVFRHRLQIIPNFNGSGAFVPPPGSLIILPPRQNTLVSSCLLNQKSSRLGILLGLVIGQAIGSFTISRIGQVSMQFVREPVWISYAASVLLTALISAVIHAFAFRKIRALKLNDIHQ